MLNIIKDSFKLTNKYIILATPLIIFSLISSLYLLFSAKGNVISIFFAILLFFLMLAAFLSGWMFMIKKCIENNDYEINALIAEFPSGVGEYFLSVCGMIIISFIAASIIMTAGYLIGLHFIGDIRSIFETLITSSSSAAALKSYIINLPVDQLIKLNLWNILILATTVLIYFLLMFYSPAVIFKKKNPFSALFCALKDLFCRKFFKNLLLFLVIFSLYFILSIFTALFSANIFMHFITTLANFYFWVFAVVLVYNYYYKNYVQIGANIDARV